MRLASYLRISNFSMGGRLLLSEEEVELVAPLVFWATTAPEKMEERCKESGVPPDQCFGLASLHRQQHRPLTFQEKARTKIAGILWRRGSR
jgi:hypothetical protein